MARDRGGRGIHRQFGRDELRKIAVLLELNRHRLPWSVLQVVGIIFDDQHGLPEKVKQTRTSAALKIQSAKHARRRAVLDRAVSGESLVFLLIKPGDGGGPTVHLTQDKSEVLEMRSATVRDSSATTIAIEDPANILVARDLLGHSDLRMTQRYNQAPQIQAVGKFQAALAVLDEELNQRRRTR